MVITSRAPVRVDFAGAWTDVKFFYEPFGGATLNAAIDHFVTGHLVAGADRLAVEYETSVPTGSGLGSSGAMNVVWLSLVRGQPVQTREEREAVAASAYDVEKALGIIGGKQDQYAAAVGGFNLFEFSEAGVTSHPVTLPPGGLAALQSLLVLCYTGQARLSSNIHENVWGNFRRGRRETVDALFTLRDSAYVGRKMLEHGQFDEFGRLLTVQFECARRLDSSTTNETVEGLFELVRDEITGGKPCGAGGGGCLLFCCKDPSLKPVVQAKLASAGARLLDFAFEFEGLTVRFEG